MDNRLLRVSYALPYADARGYFVEVPSIRLQGKWVEKLGFTVGSPILISVSQGEIKIRLQEDVDYGQDTI